MDLAEFKTVSVWILDEDDGLTRTMGGEEGTQLSREGFVCCRLSADFDSQAVCTLIVDALTQRL